MCSSDLVKIVCLSKAALALGFTPLVVSTHFLASASLSKVLEIAFSPALLTCTLTLPDFRVLTVAMRFTYLIDWIDKIFIVIRNDGVGGSNPFSGTTFQDSDYRTRAMSGNPLKYKCFLIFVKAILSFWHCLPVKFTAPSKPDPG